MKGSSRVVLLVLAAILVCGIEWHVATFSAGAEPDTSLLCSLLVGAIFSLPASAPLWFPALSPSKFSRRLGALLLVLPLPWLTNGMLHNIVRSLSQDSVTGLSSLGDQIPLISICAIGIFVLLRQEDSLRLRSKPRHLGLTCVVSALACFTILFPVLAHANGEPNCDSFHAVYGASSTTPSNYQSRLTVERANNPRPGYTEAIFILDTLTVDGHTLLSRLKMPYACTGEGNYCHILLAGRDQAHLRKIPVVGLKPDFSPTSPISIKPQAPYGLVFANLAEAIEYTNWRSHQQDIQFFTQQKVTPHANAVWLLKSCKP